MIGSARKSVGDLLKRTRSAGSELREGVESLRARIRDLNGQRGTIASAPVSREVAARRIDEFLQTELLQLAATTRSPPAARFAQPVAEYEPPRNVDRDRMVFAALLPRIADAMKADLDAFYAVHDGLTEQERSERLEALDAERLDLELAEESIIRDAETSGFPIPRRANADPRAVLADEKVLP